MKNYNYANESIKDDNWQHISKYLENTYPRENILNDENQFILSNSIEVLNNKNNADEKIQAFKDGIKNDNINTEENFNKEGK